MKSSRIPPALCDDPGAAWIAIVVCALALVGLGFSIGLLVSLGWLRALLILLLLALAYQIGRCNGQEQARPRNDAAGDETSRAA